MARLAKVLLITYALFYAASVACAAAPSGPEFSAVIESETEGTVTRTHVNFTRDSQRLVLSDSASGVDAVLIIRLDKKVAWTLIPSMKAYMETPVERQEVNPLLREVDAVSRERVGQESVDGHPAVKEKVTVDNGDGSKSSIYYWEASDIGCPIRAEALDGSWIYTFRDIKQGSQAPSLFELPEGYRKMDGLPQPDDGEDDTEQQDIPGQPDGQDPGDFVMPSPYF